MTDKWTDNVRTDRRTHRKIMLLTHTVTMRGSDVLSSVEFHPVV